MWLCSRWRTLGALAMSTARSLSWFSAWTSALRLSKSSTIMKAFREGLLAASISTVLPSRSVDSMEALRSSSNVTTRGWAASTARPSGVRPSLSTSERAFDTLKSNFLGSCLKSASAFQYSCRSAISVSGTTFFRSLGSSGRSSASSASTPLPSFGNSSLLPFSESAFPGGSFECSCRLRSFPRFDFSLRSGDLSSPLALCAEWGLAS
mmetsp:Transcript_2373/g.5112  ORF Transcript_2373/g.5112 Transcript_2373/m.5112 type:complete len:208 (+) Transcript_2373:473-1096(+)